MGIVTSFRPLTATQFEEWTAVPNEIEAFMAEFDWSAKPSAYLDKSVNGLEFLFAAANIPVDLFPTSGPNGPFAFPDHYYAFSPQQVAAANEALRGIEFDQIAVHFNAARINETYPYGIRWADGELDYLEFHYNGLRTFFAAAAELHLAALMSHG